jgi:hypothetical protein
VNERSKGAARFLRRFRVGAVAAGDAGRVSGFFDSVGNGFGDPFVEDGRNDVFGVELER